MVGARPKGSTAELRLLYPNGGTHLSASDRSHRARGTTPGRAWGFAVVDLVAEPGWPDVSPSMRKPVGFRHSGKRRSQAAVMWFSQSAGTASACYVPRGGLRRL